MDKFFNKSKICNSKNETVTKLLSIKVFKTLKLRSTEIKISVMFNIR